MGFLYPWASHVPWHVIESLWFNIYFFWATSNFMLRTHFYVSLASLDIWTTLTSRTNVGCSISHATLWFFFPICSIGWTKSFLATSLGQCLFPSIFSWIGHNVEWPPLASQHLKIQDHISWLYRALKLQFQLCLPSRSCSFPQHLAFPFFLLRWGIY